MASKLTQTDLLKLEDYARQRGDFRARAMAHKRPRTVHLGAHLTLIFEDRLTVQYQIQEMLRIERIFEPAAIQEELDAYNPLIPDGSNLKATLLIEYEDPTERARQLRALRDVERRIALCVGDTPAVTAIADEDLQRANDDKTSAVHFLRFELPAATAGALKAGAAVSFSVDHPAYAQRVEVSRETAQALARDIA